MDGFFDKYGRVIIVAVAICFVLLYLTPMRNVVGSSINGFAGNFANMVGDSLGTVKMPDGSDNVKREPSSMLMKATSYYPYYDVEYMKAFNAKVPKSATKILFTDEKAPNGVKTVDLTAAGDGDVVGWLDGTTWKVSTQNSKKSITFNANSSNMFSCIPNIKEIQFNNIDTSQVTNMRSMFYYSQVTSLNLSGFDTSKVENMGSMFDGCKNLKEINLSRFDTSKVTDMNCMFDGCESLKELNLNNFDTSKVKKMYYMFSDCKGLVSLDLSIFDTSNVTDMSNMFNGCNKLVSVKVRSQTDIDNFKTTSSVPNTKFEIA